MLNLDFLKSQRDVKETFWCSTKERLVEVTFDVRGKFLRRKHCIIDCPARSDGGKSCDRRCLNRLHQHHDLSVRAPRFV